MNKKKKFYHDSKQAAHQLAILRNVNSPTFVPRDLKSVCKNQIVTVRIRDLKTDVFINGSCDGIVHTNK